MTRTAGGRALAGAIMLAALGGMALTGGATATAASQSHHASKTILRSSQGKSGVQLVTNQKLALYAFSRDNGKSTCYGRCDKTWLPLIAHGKLVAAPGSQVKQKKLGTVRRRNGQLQVAYNHQPLYQYRLDTKPGDTKGSNKYQFGGNWELMGANGSTLPPAGYP